MFWPVIWNARCQGVRSGSLADLEDQTLAASRERGVDRETFSTEIATAVRKAAYLLGVRKSMQFERASESVDRTVELCRALLAHGLAYEKLRSVYFDISRDKGYGQMSNMDIDKVSLGKTVDMDDYVKENPRDFTSAQEGNPAGPQTWRYHRNRVG